ncbi:pyridoxal phosphate-dependent transferase [Xylogone sp. PMI_703]|nr:pyridoxal phosphate-dependent transferase [Xylogone sp. PMI_703]
MASSPPAAVASPGSQHVFSRDYAAMLDARDPLSTLRAQFRIPTKSDIAASSFASLRDTAFQSLHQAHPESNDSQSSSSPASSDGPCTYLCGNSLGLQPSLTAVRIQQYLTTWSTQGVFGHFKPLESSPLPIWLDVDASAAQSIAPIVGASPSEVAVMQTLTANLHLLMCAFYKPDINGRHKIIIESKAFPSDHYAVESQILHHGLSPSTSMVTIEPLSWDEPVISTEYILSVIEEHASTTAILLLPGIQYYTGQFLDIPKITAAARKAGIFVIWDLAHAVGNVPLKLHDWDVDAAAWCTYKYLNAGPGAIGGFFIHERNSQVSSTTQKQPSISGEGFVNRLSGWWGSDKSIRFAMDNTFVPIPGAAGFQLSNPSVLDITSLNASLEVFAKAGGMVPLRERSIRLTVYLETLLLQHLYPSQPHFKIITPRDPNQRGAQLSLLLEEGLLDVVMSELEKRALVVDERRPDVVRVAPAPLYNSFQDIFEFVTGFGEALEVAVKAKKGELKGVETTKELEMTT